MFSFTFWQEIPFHFFEENWDGYFEFIFCSFYWLFFFITLFIDLYSIYTLCGYINSIFLISDRINTISYKIHFKNKKLSKHEITEVKKSINSHYKNNINILNKPALDITAKSVDLINRIFKQREKIYTEMQLSEYDNYRYNELKNLYDCYTNLTKTKIKNQFDYDEVEWLFNNGNLRNNEEIKEHYSYIKMINYRDNEFINHLMDLADVQYLYGKTCWRLGIIIGEAVSILITIPFYYKQIEYYSMVKKITTVIKYSPICSLFIVPFFMLLFGLTRLSFDFKVEEKRYELYREAGVRKRFNGGLAIEAITYSLIGASVLAA